MSISKNSIIAGLGLALSLASGLVQAGQSCDLNNENVLYSGVQCELDLRGIPANKTIVFNVLARVEAFNQPLFNTYIQGNKPRIYVRVVRGNYAEITHFNYDLNPLQPNFYRLSKNFSFNTGAGVPGQTGYNFIVYTRLREYDGAVSRLQVKTQY